MTDTTDAEFWNRKRNHPHNKTDDWQADKTHPPASGNPWPRDPCGNECEVS